MTCDTAINSGHWDWCMQTGFLQCSVCSALQAHTVNSSNISSMAQGDYKFHCEFLKNLNVQMSLNESVKQRVVLDCTQAMFRTTSSLEKQ